MAIDLSALSSREALSAVYIGYYDRAADVAGMQFWEQVVANTSLDLVAITSDFASQSETQEVHPFFADPATSSPATFITSLYQNLFNRDPDTAGLEFWSGALQDAIDGVEGAISVGEIITAIIEGAVDVEGGTQDRTTILNKIEVAVSWTDAAEAAGDEFGALAMASAKSIIEGVTDDPATVTAAKSTIDDFFADDNGGGNGGTPGDTILLTSGQDVLFGAENDDEFLAYIAQNPTAGGISNTLASGDVLDGSNGNDRLYAEITDEFLGGGGGNDRHTDIMPRLMNIEEIDIEVRDDGYSNRQYFEEYDNNYYNYSDGNRFDMTIVDAKYIEDHVEIGSYYSDGDLLIENLTTLTSSGNARNTSDITITMDHTDNRDSDRDPADLIVLFDNDYLLSGQESEGEIYYWLLDEDAELAGLTDRLNNIDVDGIRFNITNADGTVTAVNLEAIESNLAGTHQGFVNALQDRLQELIADGTLPAGTTLTLDPTITDTTFLDDGSESAPIPAIVLTSGDGSEVVATGFSRIQEEIGEYDVYGRFDSFNETLDQPISIDVDLHKVGRGGDGGNLVIGGKTDDTQPGIADGIEVFHLNVLGAGNDDPNGAMTKPSSLGTVTSTGDELREIYIATDPAYAVGDTFASLEIRDGFNKVGRWDNYYNNRYYDTENGDLQLVNADAFLGDLALGTHESIVNLDTLTAQGGGDVTFYGWLNGSETDQAYSYTTGGGDDMVVIDIDGDAVDYANSSLNVSTGAGNDYVEIDAYLPSGSNNHLNQNILDNVTVDTGAGDDVYVQWGDRLNADVNLGSGNDVLYADGDRGGEIWALNVDALRAGTQGLGNRPPEDLPGEQTSLAYIGGASVTVTLSGPGVANLAAGGGVMATDANGTDDVAPGATAGNDGYESSVTIGSLINGNRFYGDQRDINEAIMEAINEDPVLSTLLTAFVGANNTLVIASKVPGAFEDVDLRVEIDQRNAADANAANAVLAEARDVFSNSALVVGDLFPAVPGPYGSPTAPGADLTTSATSDAWYDGLSADGDIENAMSAAVGEGLSNTHTNGSAQTSNEQDSVYNGGSGDDVLVLSTDAASGTPGAFTVSSNNALINMASNETVKFTGQDVGDDTVMNFTTAGAVNLDTITGPYQAPSDAEEGLDFLDFTSYLTSREDSSAGPGPDSSDSNTVIPVTLDYSETSTLGGTGDGSGNANVEANEVAAVRMTADTTDSETFGGLTASVVQNLFNNDGTYTGFGADSSFGNLDAANFTVEDYQKTDQEELIGNGKAIFMVENAANLGEYKIFELTWSGDETSATGQNVTAVELGSSDFGDSLTNLDDINLVGSEDHAALLTFGFA